MSAARLCELTSGLQLQSTSKHILVNIKTPTDFRMQKIASDCN